MLKPHCLILLVSLMADGGTSTPVPDAGIVTPPPDRPTPSVDAGTPALPPAAADAIRWPKDLRPLATLDGPAVLAAHAALQQVLSRTPKEYASTCEYSAKGMEVIVGEEGGLYFVRIRRRADKCGWNPGANLGFDGLELYAVSPDGRVLARYPYMP
jgi:hypothetical protein